MNRLAVLRKLELLELAKGELEVAYTDLDNTYCKAVEVKFSIETTAFNPLYTGTFIPMDKVRLRKFIATEIELVEAEINSLITKYLYKGSQ